MLENTRGNKLQMLMVDQISQSGGGAVLSALQNASRKTGVGFDFLYKMAKRESALDPAAKAATSSAAGLFQFIEQTWLGAVKKYGAAHGLAAQAAEITRGQDGRYRVADEGTRAAILNGRFDAQKAASLAAELANENKNALEKRLGRAVGAGELYAAHFLGVSGAVKLLSAPANAKAADLLPAAANANKPVFFENGVAKPVSAVIASIEKSMGAAVAYASDVMEKVKARPLNAAAPILAPLPAVSLAPLPVAGPSAHSSTTGGSQPAAPAASAPRTDPHDAVRAHPASMLRPQPYGALREGPSVSALQAAAPLNAPDDFWRSATLPAGAGLSPLALAILQALDPAELLGKDRKR